MISARFNVSMNVTWAPSHSGTRTLIIEANTCCSGRRQRKLSFSSTRTTWSAVLISATTFACVSVTPLGFPVVPDV